ncbi:MAG: NADP-dependent oxidoreductase [Tetrasphaera sp.]
MRALVAYSTSTSPVLDHVQEPGLGPTDVRIRVAAAAINPVDVGIVAGPVRAAVDLPEPIGLGWDVSGTIAEVGRAVTDLEVGDRVAGMLNVIARKPGVGTHADSTVLPRQAVARVPATLDLVDAASMPLTALSAYQAVALLGPGEGRSLLVTGAAGALGGHALSLARRAGWVVTGLAREADEEFVTRSGATLATSIEATSYDAVLDAAVLPDDAIAAVRDRGVIVGVAPAAPITPQRSVTVESLFVQEDGDLLEALLAMTVTGDLLPRIAGRAPLSEAARGYQRVAGGGQRGRWMLIP